MIGFCWYIRPLLSSMFLFVSYWSRFNLPNRSLLFNVTITHTFDKFRMFSYFIEVHFDKFTQIIARQSGKNMNRTYTIKFALNCVTIIEIEKSFSQLINVFILDQSKWNFKVDFHIHLYGWLYFFNLLNMDKGFFSINYHFYCFNKQIHRKFYAHISHKSINWIQTPRQARLYIHV